IATSQTAIVPLRSLFIVARWIFKSWTGSAFPLATAGALAADACLIAVPLDLMKKYAPTATTATATAMPIHSPIEPFSLISSGVSNMNSSDSRSPRHFCKRSPIASDEKDKLPPSEIRDCAREGSAFFNAGTAIEITLKAREVHHWEGDSPVPRTLPCFAVFRRALATKRFSSQRRNSVTHSSPISSLHTSG